MERPHLVYKAGVAADLLEAFVGLKLQLHNMGIVNNNSKHDSISWQKMNKSTPPSYFMIRESMKIFHVTKQVIQL
jgi:hypothetical protein